MFYFVGFMGTGKSTIASLLKERYGMIVYELDQLIVEHMNLSIPEIFNQFGEEIFRQAEYEMLIKKREQNSIISCGGGIVETKDCLKFLKDKYVIFIDTPFEIIYDRIYNDNNRPNAHNKSKNDLFQLYNKRYSLYNEIATNKIDGSLSIEEIVDNVYYYIKQSIRENK